MKTREPFRHAWLAAAVLLLLPLPPLAAEVQNGINGCEIFTPKGAYLLVTLEFDVPEAPAGYQRWTYRGGLRDGVMRMDEGIGLRQEGGRLRLDNGRLAGSFQRNNSLSTSSTSLRAVPPAIVTVDATVQDGVIAGTAKIGAAQGKVTGRLVPEADLARSNSVPQEQSWPAFLGPTGTGHAPLRTGAATIDRLEQMRLVWRAEEIDIGQGIGSSTRFMDKWKDAASRRTCSGSSSPIAAGGRLYFSYFIPAPRAEGEPEKKNPSYLGTEAELSAAMLAEARAAGFDKEKLPWYAHEKVYQSADDVVLCLDAASGKTLWKAVIRGRGTNIQHHKAGPFNMSPAFADGKLFVLGLSGWLYAFDAASGKPLWATRSMVDYSNALLVCDGVVIAPAGNQWGGYDASTGKLLWTGSPRGVATLNRWAKDGREWLVGYMGPQHAPTGIACLDPRTGKELWRHRVNVLTSGRGRGPGGLSVIQDTLLVFQDNGTGAKGDPVKPVLAAYRLTMERPEPLWQVGAAANSMTELGPVHPEAVPIVVHGKFAFTADLRTVDITSGNVIDQAAGPLPRNGGYLQVIEDLVLVRVDGTHGGIRCGWYKVAPDGRIRSLSEAEWSPPFGGGTTSYHHPIFYPSLAGRLFLRQQDGLYCWDLRSSKTP